MLWYSVQAFVQRVSVIVQTVAGAYKQLVKRGCFRTCLIMSSSRVVSGETAKASTPACLLLR